MSGLAWKLVIKGDAKAGSAKPVWATANWQTIHSNQRRSTRQAHHDYTFFFQIWSSVTSQPRCNLGGTVVPGAYETRSNLSTFFSKLASNQNTHHWRWGDSGSWASPGGGRRQAAAKVQNFLHRGHGGSSKTEENRSQVLAIARGSYTYGMGES